MQPVSLTPPLPNQGRVLQGQSLNSSPQLHSRPQAERKGGGGRKVVEREGSGKVVRAFFKIDPSSRREKVREVLKEEEAERIFQNKIPPPSIVIFVHTQRM